MFLGFWPLESTVVGVVIVRDGSGHSVDADAPPVYRVYSAAGPMPAMSGTLTALDTGAITGASNASPIVISSAGHQRVTGDRVTIAGIVGNTAANGSFTITVVDSNSFSLNGSTGNGTYLSGGTWHQAGLYQYSFSAGMANGFADGQTYTIMISFVVSSQSYTDVQSIIVT